MAKKPGIPTHFGGDPSPVLRALKENVEIITGRRDRIALLDTTNLTSIELLLAQKINEIIARLQD